MELTQATASEPGIASSEADVWAGVPIAGHLFSRNGSKRSRIAYIDTEDATPLHRLQEEYDLSGKILIRTVVDGDVQDLTIDVGTTDADEKREENGQIMTESQLEELKRREREAGREEAREEDARELKNKKREIEDLKRDIKDLKSDEKRQRNRANTLRDRLDNEIDERQRKVKSLHQEYETEMKQLRTERDELQRKVMRLEAGKGQGQEFLSKLVEQIPALMQGYMHQNGNAQTPPDAGGRQIAESTSDESNKQDVNEPTQQAEQQQYSEEQIQALRAQVQQEAIKLGLQAAEDGTAQDFADALEATEREVSPMLEFDARMWMKMALGLAHDGHERGIEAATMAQTIRPVVTRFAPEGGTYATMLKNMPASAATTMLKKQVPVDVSADLEAYITEILTALKSTL